MLNLGFFLRFFKNRAPERHIILVLSICLSDAIFESRDVSSFSAPLVYLQGVWIKFVCEGHHVKIKVTGTKVVQNTYSRNVKLRSAITSVL